MKTTGLYVVSGLSLACAAVMGEGEPALGSARVTLEYRELKELLEASRRPESPPEPQPASAFLSAEYVVDFSGEALRVQGRFRVANFTKSRIAVPILPEGVGVVSGDTSEAMFVREGGAVALVLEGETVQEVEGHLAVPVAELGDGQRRIVFPVLAAGSSSVRLVGLPEGVRAVVLGAGSLGAEADVRRFALLNAAREVNVLIQPDRPLQPSTWEWRTEVLVTPGDVGLDFEAKVLAALIDGDGREIRVPMPGAIRGLRVDAGAQARWTLGEPSSENAERILEVLWEEGRVGSREIHLRYSVPLSYGAELWPLRAPAATIPGAENLYAVLLPSTVEIQDRSQVGASGRTPEWLAREIGGRSVVLVAGGVAKDLAVGWLPIEEPESLAIRSATFSTRMVADGAALTQARFEIETEAAARWELTLPPGASLLNCSMDGVTFRPVRRGDALEIAVSPPAAGKPAALDISFSVVASRMDPVGGVLKCALPTTETFLHSLAWHLEIPEDYEVAGIESNAQILPSAVNGRIHLARQLVRGGVTAAEIHYTKRGLEN